jgi:hypothetical protein
MKTRLTLIVICFVTTCCWSQTFDRLKLVDDEIPKEYKTTEEILSKAVQPKIFYDNPGLYENILGTVKSKDYQSFQSKDDEGTVFFFEYESKVDGEGFLEGLLWGGSKPTKEHPEEYLIKDNILIIWSFVKKSEIRNLSRKKIKRLL